MNEMSFVSFLIWLAKKIIKEIKDLGKLRNPKKESDVFFRSVLEFTFLMFICPILIVGLHLNPVIIFPIILLCVLRLYYWIFWRKF